MILKEAVKEDFGRIKDFYIHVIENTETMKDCCRWIYGLHPYDELIKAYIDSGDMYYGERDGKIIAVIALTKKQGDDYHDIPWQKEFADDEVAVGHIMCCDPALKRQGLAKDLLKSVCELCRSLGKKAYRFDTLASNTPAQALYDSLGYKRIAQRRWYARNTGWTDFILYEMLLRAFFRDDAKDKYEFIGEGTCCNGIE